ncbi:MAG: hypothetical protein K0R25_963 [Rickettsiaceae bacterium]|jgi:hypothetical protein|nr:hypothetical protein [Rickettsiaceae bacterium]
MQLFMKEKQLGEQILLASGELRFSGKPGWLDRRLREKNERKIIFEERYIDPASEEYQELCQAAYDDFKENYGDESKRELQKVEKKYKELLKEAEAKDGIKWMSVFVSNLGLASQVRGALMSSQNDLQNRSEETKIEPDIGLQVTESKPAEFSSLASQEIIGEEGFLESPSVFEKGEEEDKEESQIASFANSLADSAVQTVGDAIDWLNERSNGIAYGMVMIGAASMATSSGSVAATVAAAGFFLPEVEANKGMEVDGWITNYCGPTIKCNFLREAAKKKKIGLIEFDQKQLISEIDTRTKTLIIQAHGNENGEQLIETDHPMQPDELATYFPNVRFTHALGCKIGTNPQQNFGENSLKVGQFLFLHAGNERITDEADRQITSFLSLKSNLGFPSANPLKIIYKRRAKTSIFAQLLPFSLSEIASAIKDGAEIDELYNLITTHIALQKKSALKKLSANKKDKDLLVELEKLGYRDFSVDVDFIEKEKLVKNYLWESCHSVAIYEGISPAKLEDLRTIIGSGLVDVDQTFSDGASTISYIAAAEGHYKYLEILVDRKANLDKANNDGVTPLFAASQNGHHKCVETLLTNELNKADPDKAKNDGATPLFVASQMGHHECIKTLLEKGADPDKTTSSGATPLFIASQKGHHECIKALFANKSNKADPDKATNNGITPLLNAIYEYRENPDLKNRETIILLIKDGADPELKTLKHGTAYQFAGKDQALIKQMKEARDKYLKERKENEKKPSSTVEKPKPTSLKDGEVGEIAMGL